MVNIQVALFVYILETCIDYDSVQKRKQEDYLSIPRKVI